MNNIKGALYNAIDKVLQFREDASCKNDLSPEALRNLVVEDLPLEKCSLVDVEKDFDERILKYCANDTSVKSMGFPDCGNSNPALVGTLYSELLQQNLINQLGSSPSVTFVEIATIRWLRDVVGYHNCPKQEIKHVCDVGGILDFGGTMSNTIAMMLARENWQKDTMLKGVSNPEHFKVLLPEDIAHYSIESSLMWLGMGSQIVTVKTKDFRMDQRDLKKKLKKHKGNIMACAVYAGDSKTMTVEDLNGVYDIVKNENSNIWLHVDACHGFSLGFSEKLRHKINGIEKYDSITTDPHKVLMIPYGLSILLTKDPQKFELLRTDSDLILKSQEFAFGQITPFIGSKNAACLKLWFLIKTLGKKEIGKIIEQRHETAKYLANRLREHKNFVVLNDVGINSVMFLTVPPGVSVDDLEKIDKATRKTFQTICNEGKYYLHNFPIKIRDIFGRSEVVLHPLRYMSGNPNVTVRDIDKLIDYLVSIIN